MKRGFDLIVVGSGSAGKSVMYPCRKAGWSVAVIDSMPFGGTCQLRGCDPKKVLVGAAELVDWNHRMGKAGVPAAATQIHWPALMSFKRTFTQGVPESNEKAFREAGIEPISGRARFSGPTTLRVGREELTAGHMLIAAGARPRTLGIPGEEHLTTSTEFLELDSLPERILFVGGGYISFELAHVAARAGSRVGILHRSGRPLPQFEPQLVEALVGASREAGIDVRLHHEVEAVERSGGAFAVQTRTPEGPRTLEAELVVHGAGRVPDIDDLDLASGQVERDGRGVVVNEFLQSASNPAVYAAGDAASPGPPLTPVAGIQGAAVAENLLHGNTRRPDYRGVATTVYSIPPLAAVGLREEQARERNLRFTVNSGDASSWYYARRVKAGWAAYKVLVEEASGRILGAHLLGPHAEEAINLFAMAIRFGLSAAQMKEVAYGYPTACSSLKYML